VAGQGKTRCMTGTDEFVFTPAQTVSDLARGAAKLYFDGIKGL
jgi:hypothetical protein